MRSLRVAVAFATLIVPRTIRYFWGIATVDIDMSVLDFSCDPGKEFSSEVGAAWIASSTWRWS